MTNDSVLQKKIADRTAIVSIVGLGYVGLPLAVEAARAGYKIRAVENNPMRCSQVNEGRNYISDVRSADLRQFVSSGSIKAFVNFDPIGDADIVIICVPTPLTKNKDPDISYIRNATEEIATRIKRGTLVILESTTYPGTTEEIIKTRIEKQGLQAGVDFFLAFSPERVDPGNKTYNTANTPKIVGGLTAKCTELSVLFYSNFIQQIHRVSSPRVAETTKLFENIFRSVNIALVNEMAVLCERMDIDAYEVIAAAATKPYGFQAFWPGPGVGGHCIPLDPYYLAWKGKEYDLHLRFIELAGEINENMPRYVVSRIAEILNRESKAVTGSKILQLGVAYKKDIDDWRESPAVHVYELLKDAGAKVDVADPHVGEFWIREHDFTYGKSGPSVKTAAINLDRLKDYDLIVLITDHAAFDYKQIAEKAPLIFDTRNAFGSRGLASQKIMKLTSRSRPESKDD